MFKRCCLMLFVLLLAGTVLTTPAFTGGKKKGQGNYFKVEAKGKLKTGIFAIGGETTGVILKTDNLGVELDFRTKPALRREANKLNGKTVIVHGFLTTRRGVEIRRVRYIVEVTAIKEAK